MDRMFVSACTARIVTLVLKCAVDCELVRRVALVFLAVLTFSASAAATQHTWTGDFFGVWNQSLNWSPAGIPDSSIADVKFTGNNIGTVNISTSVDSRSLTFSNPAGAYAITSNAGVTLSEVSAINVAAGVTGVQTINLANIAAGSLIFPSAVGLTIANNSIAANTTLVIGPNTVIKQSGADSFVEVKGAGKTEISGALRANMTLIKTGPGTLILSNPANTYTRTNAPGTFVDEGTLLLGVGTAIPTGERVYVSGSGEFNIGSLSNSAATTMGTLQFDGGTFRVPSGSGDYYVEDISMDAGTVNFSGTSNFWLHLTGSGPFNSGVYVSANSTPATWIGCDTFGCLSRIQNDTANPLPFQVIGGTTPSGIDLDAGIILSSGTPGVSNPTFVKQGAGTMRLTNPGNTANINVIEGKLRVDDMVHLGSGAITLNDATTLQYGGSGETTTKNLTINGTATVQVSTPGANLNYNGVMSQISFASINVSGPGAGSAPSTLMLNNNNAYYGNTSIYDNAILATPTINNIGDASPIGLNLFSTVIILGTMDARGTMLLTGASPAYSTNRKVTLNGLYTLGAGGAIGVQNPTTNLTWSGQITGSGSLIKTGAGKVILSNAANSYAGGTLIEAGRLDVDNDRALGPAGVRINAGGILRYTASATVGRSIVLDGGTLEAPSGISLANSGGALQGTGTAIGNVTNSGIVVPEGPNAVLQVEGNYTQNSSGRLMIFADLFLPPGMNPRLSVTGNIALDGTLQMNLGGMGQFRGHRSIDVLDWTGSLSGTFSTLQLPSMGGNFTWDTSQLYISGVLTLTGPTLEGDYNRDNFVNAADYTVWRNSLGQTVALGTGADGTGPGGVPDGVVDQLDYSYWKSHYGNTGGGAGAGQSVPEPATVSLMLIAISIVALATHAGPPRSTTRFAACGTSCGHPTAVRMEINS